MLELTMHVSEIDYEAAIRLFAGEGAMAGMAAMALRSMGAGAKDEMAAKFMNNNAEKLASMLEAAGAQKGVSFKITDASAKVI